MSEGAGPILLTGATGSMTAGAARAGSHGGVSVLWAVEGRQAGKRAEAENGNLNAPPLSGFWISPPMHAVY
jgi:hypothetical protein